MRSWLLDLRYAVRGLVAAPAFTSVAMLTLGLGIGATTALFSLLDQAVLQRLPVRHPEQLRAVTAVSRSGESMSNVPSELFAELRDSRRAFAGVFAWSQDEMNVDAGGDADRALVQYVSGGYYSTLGVPMVLGRPIVDADEDSSERVAILGHRYWTRRFGADPAVLGKTLHLNGRAATIVGVTPPGFFGMDRGVSPDVSVPLPARSPFRNLWVTGRLAPGATDAEARAEADAALLRALETIRPRLDRYREADREWILTLRAGLASADKGLGRAMRPYLDPLRVLFLLSAGVLLIACVNVANLLLARALARAHEFGVRLALGAGRARVIRQVLTESVVLAVLGCVTGVAMAVFIHRALVHLLMQDLPHQSLGFSLNAHMLAFSVAIAALTVLMFGVAPALRATRIDLATAMQSAAPRGRGRRHVLGRALIVAQVAAALVLLLGAGLLLRSFRALSALDTGVSLDRMLTVRIALSPRETQRRETAQVYSGIVDRVSGIPGVVSAAPGWDYALASGGANKSIWVEGQPPERGQAAGFNVVGPGFFATAGMPIVLGREFSGADAAGAPLVVVVNEAFVRRYAGSRNPIGLRVGDEGAASIGKYEVIGVVRDALTMALRNEAAPMLYQPLLQDEWADNVVLHVRTAGDPRLLTERVRAALRAFDPRLPVYDITTLDDRRSRALRRDRMMAALSSALGAVALLLTTIGIYGVVAYGVARRTAEIGIRMALGATPASVRRLVVGETLRLVAIGAAIGIPLSLAGAGVLSSMLFGVAPRDPLTLAASVSVLIAAAVLAGDLPARRAARLEPSAALRRD